MSYAVRQNPANGGNYSKGRSGAKVDKIVVHHAATTNFDGIGRTFQAAGRNASAHYGVGRNQNVDQYVDEENTAWHAGNWNANISSIGIENVNSSGAPAWDIDPATFETLVELCRDIRDRHGLGKLVVGKNLFGHKDFSATACPGQLYARLQNLADRVNGSVSAGGGPVVNPPRKSNDVVADEVINGAWGNGDDRFNRLSRAGYDAQLIQSIVNQKLGGQKAPAPAKTPIATIAAQVIAGAWGNNPDRANRLAAAGYDANAVQAEVNKQMGVGVKPAKKSNEQVANEIIAGQGGWGNNPERANKLAAAGFDAASVQAIVNKKLGF